MPRFEALPTNEQEQEEEELRNLTSSQFGVQYMPEIDNNKKLSEKIKPECLAKPSISNENFKRRNLNKLSQCAAMSALKQIHLWQLQ